MQSLKSAQHLKMLALADCQLFGQYVPIMAYTCSYAKKECACWNVGSNCEPIILFVGK